MGYTKDQLLTRLKDLQIDFAQYQHPAVLTVEAQDKKSRFYVVSALAETKVDMKILSQRLGLGKGGIRMAPEEALGSFISKAWFGKGSYKNGSRRSIGPDTSAIHARDLDKFLKSIGREASYVDLEANPPVGKDQPPDLTELVPSSSTILSGPPEKAVMLQGDTEDPVSGVKKATAVSYALAVFTTAMKDKSAVAAHQPTVFSDAELFVEEILNKTSNLLPSEIKEDSFKQHGEHLGTVVADSIRKRLSPDLKSLAIMYKNTAYAQRFYAGTHHHPKRL